MMFRPGEVGDHLQHRAHFDVLEVERELLAGVARRGALHQPVRVFLDRLHLEDELGVGLVGRVFPDAARLDHHARVAALLEGVDEAHRGAEVAHVQAAHEVARHVGVEEVDHHLAALLADVDADVGRRQVDHDAALGGIAAAEIDVAQVVAHVGAGRGLGEHRRRGRRRGLHRGGGGRGLGAVDGDHELVAVERLRVGEVAREVHHQARAVGGLHDRHALQVAFARLDLVAVEAVDGVGQVDRDARRVGDGEALRRRREGLLQPDLDDDLAALDLGEVDRLDRVLRGGLGPRERRGEHEGERGERGPEFAAGWDAERRCHFLSPLPASSRSGSTLCRSAQSPALS